MSYSGFRSGNHVQEWFDDEGKLHRDGAPAQIYRDGICIWFQHGVYPWEDGAAIEYIDGSPQSYFLCGKHVPNRMLFMLLTKGSVDELPLYLGMWHDEY